MFSAVSYIFLGMLSHNFVLIEFSNKTYQVNIYAEQQARFKLGSYMRPAYVVLIKFFTWSNGYVSKQFNNLKSAWRVATH